MMAAIALLMAVSAQAQYLNDSEKVFTQDKWYEALRSQVWI